MVGCHSIDKVYLVVQEMDKVYLVFNNVTKGKLFIPHQKMYVGSLRVSLRLTSLVPLSWSRVTWELGLVDSNWQCKSIQRSWGDWFSLSFFPGPPQSRQCKKSVQKSAWTDWLVDGLGHLNELGYVEGEGEQSDWDDVDQQPPGDFNSVSIQFQFSSTYMIQWEVFSCPQTAL